jgi:hypothetical protein
MRRARQFALTGVIGGLLALLMIGSAQAESGTGTLSGGGIYCLNPVYRVDQAAILGSANPNGKFSVWWGTSAGATNTRIFVSGHHDSSVNEVFTTSTNPAQFPGYFQFCINNTNATEISFTLAIGGG